ncbi:hypothetical protein HOY82DRAFT_286127 [Tuber indicum]|nr:hypothetical protein HOY82DRAFT_286127 [Tuber indicum]
MDAREYLYEYLNGTGSSCAHASMQRSNKQNLDESPMSQWSISRPPLPNVMSLDSILSIQSRARTRMREDVRKGIKTMPQSYSWAATVFQNKPRLQDSIVQLIEWVEIRRRGGRAIWLVGGGGGDVRGWLKSEVQMHTNQPRTWMSHTAHQQPASRIAPFEIRYGQKREMLSYFTLSHIGFKCPLPQYPCPSSLSEEEDKNVGGQGGAKPMQFYRYSIRHSSVLGSMNSIMQALPRAFSSFWPTQPLRTGSE